MKKWIDSNPHWFFLISFVFIVGFVFFVTSVAATEEVNQPCPILVPAQEESLYGKYLEDSDAHYRELDEYGIWYIDGETEKEFQIVGYSLTEDSDIYDSGRCVIESTDD